MELLIAAIVLGIIHGLGSDHLVAVTSYVSGDSRPGKAVGFAVRFALGHLGTLLILGLIGITIGFEIGPSLQTGLEGLNGLLLAGLGVWLLVDYLRGGLHQHTHDHDGEAHSHMHYHEHLDSHEHEHRLRGVTAVGALFGLSGLRSLLLLAPLAGSVNPWLLPLLAVGFAGGIIASMASYAWGASLIYRRTAAAHPLAARAATGLFALGFGLFWARGLLFGA